MGQFKPVSDDLSIISKLGNNPGADDGLSPDELKNKFDSAALILQQAHNDLVDKLNTLFGNEGSAYLLLAGGKMTGTLDMGGNKILSLPEPKSDSEPATKKYADGSALNAYPVGSIYLSVKSDSPASLFGGTWERLKDRFLLGAGDSYNAGSTGGEATHKLTVSEIPSHNHVEMYGDRPWGDEFASGSSASTNVTKWSANETKKTNMTGSTGGGDAHNNMPPYLVVYMWKRTA